MTDDRILCYCFGVKRADVVAHFAKPGARLQDLIVQTRVTTKCTACAVDLDIVLDELQGHEQRTKAQAEEIASSKIGLRQRVDRIDSGFFLCDGKVKTSVRLANYPPPAQSTDLCSPHTYRVTLFGNDGSVCAGDDGTIGVNEEITIDLAALPGCPEQGWFLLTVHPEGPGRYGTLRPQTAFEGRGWTACYHTQLHTFASRSGRRSGAPLRSVNGLTRTTVSVINGSVRPSDYCATIESSAGAESIEGRLAGNGACLLDIDALFARRPDNASLIFRMESEQPTRKNLIYRHPDGSLGFDHFPNLV